MASVNTSFNSIASKSARANQGRSSKYIRATRTNRGWRYAGFADKEAESDFELPSLSRNVSIGHKDAKASKDLEIVDLDFVVRYL